MIQALAYIVGLGFLLIAVIGTVVLISHMELRRFFGGRPAHHFRQLGPSRGQPRKRPS